MKVNPYSSYKHYILKNHIQDSPEAYRTYLSSYTTALAGMSPAMIDQQIAISYKYRFSIQF